MIICHIVRSSDVSKSPKTLEPKLLLVSVEKLNNKDKLISYMNKWFSKLSQIEWLNALSMLNGAPEHHCINIYVSLEPQLFFYVMFQEMILFCVRKQ